MMKLWLAAAMAAGICLLPNLAVSAEACRECYIWQKADSGPDVARVWCCFEIRYEVKGTTAEQDLGWIRKMLASLAAVSGLTFNEVAKGGDLIIFKGSDAYETALVSADTDPEIARFNQSPPGGVLNGSMRLAILAGSPCIASTLEDDNRTVHSAIVITTANVSVCLEKTIESTLGLERPTGGKEDAAALCALYASYRRLARTYDDINELVRNSAADCTQF